MLLIYTFFSADLLGKLIILLLLVSSLYSLAVIAKYAYFFHLHDQLGDNLKLYLPKLKKIVRINAEPSMYLDVYDSVLDVYAVYSDSTEEYLKQNFQLVDRRIDEIFLKWEMQMIRDIDNISILGSISPFIGLFGTVLGIISSFQAIAKANSNNITVVAPALSEALCVTALGIFVAIPANIGANFFYSKFDHLSKDLKLFNKSVLDHFFSRKERM